MGLAGTEVAIGRDETESQLVHASRFVAEIRKESLRVIGPESARRPESPRSPIAFAEPRPTWSRAPNRPASAIGGGSVAKDIGPLLGGKV